MSQLIRMSLDAPGGDPPFEGGTGQLQLVNLAGGPVGRATFSPAGDGHSTSSRSPAPTAARPRTLLLHQPAG